MVTPSPLPAPTETISFPSRDGTKLHGEYYASREAAKGAALIIHGYGDHIGRYREVAGTLTERNVAAFGIDLRGHGRSEGPRGGIRRFTDYLEDVEAALDAFANFPGGEGPLMVVGHSNGGLVTLRWLSEVERVPERLRAAVLSSPFLGLKVDVSPAKIMVGRVASKLMPSLALPSKLDVEHLTSDREKQAERAADTLCHDVANARWYGEVLDTWQWLDAYAQRIQVPTLWLVAGGDRVADASSARRLRAKLRAPSRYCEFEGYEHEVFNEAQRAIPLEKLGAFADEIFS